MEEVMKYPKPVLEVYEFNKVFHIENYISDEAKLRLKKLRAQQMASMVANKVYDSLYAQLMAEES
jgi:uncharacterized protein (DUF2164 family)